MASAPVMPSTGLDAQVDNMVGHNADYIPPHSRALHDKHVSFDEYHYYAQMCRRDEALNEGAAGNKSGGFLDTLIPGRSAKANKDAIAKTEAPSEVNTNDPNARMNITDEEWINASRALRLATWPAMFYLITTDILGPFTLPYAMATTGWGPGIALYTVFGVLAGYSGYLLWKMFLGLDSYQYPCRTYGDLAFRIYGSWARYTVNLLQSVQLLCNVGVIVIQNGLSLSQVSRFKLCFAICCLVWAIAGFLIGQIRTLKNFGWIANAAIWLNLLVIFITMGVAAHSPPAYDAAQDSSAGAVISGPGGPLVAQLPDGSYPPVQTSAGLPSTNFSAAVNGLMQAVYSYGGAMLFTEFMSEMKRPYDFIKAMWGAQAFIYFFYMFYGCFLYGYQGQYVVNPSYQGLSPYNWSVAANVISMVTALIAAGLYGNIGIKVLYNNVFSELFKAPPLTSKKGRILWAVIVPIYWSVAFIIAAAIPNFSGLTGFVAAACILQFTYTFPPFLYLGYLIQRETLVLLNLAPKLNHSKPGKVSDSAASTNGTSHNEKHVNGTAVAGDSSDNDTPPSYAGNGNSSLTSQPYRPRSPPKAEYRSAMRKAILRNLPHSTWLTVYFLGALVTAALGMYASIETLIVAFSNPNTTSFTCHSPLDSS